MGSTGSERSWLLPSLDLRRQAVAPQQRQPPKSLLREVRSSAHCGLLRDQTSVMRSPTALAVRPIPWHMSIHDRDYLWTAHGHSCLVIMAAVAPKSLLREVRSSPHCGSVRDRRQRQRQQQH